jgi:hypothetical protein
MPAQPLLNHPPIAPQQKNPALAAGNADTLTRETLDPPYPYRSSATHPKGRSRTAANFLCWTAISSPPNPAIACKARLKQL